MSDDTQTNYFIIYDLDGERLTSRIKASDEEFARARFESQQPTAQIIGIGPSVADTETATTSYPDSSSTPAGALGSLGPMPMEARFVCGVGWGVLVLGILSGLVAASELGNGWLLLNGILGGVLVCALLVGIGKGLHYFQAIYDLLRRQAPVPGEGKSSFN